MKKAIVVILLLIISAPIVCCAESNLKQAQYWYINASQHEVGNIAHYARLALMDKPNEPQALFLLGYGIAHSALMADNGEGDDGYEEFSKWQEKEFLKGIDTMKMALNYKPVNGAEICWRIVNAYSSIGNEKNSARDSERVYIKKGAYEYPNDPYSEKCLFENGDYESYIKRYPKGDNFRKAFFARGDSSSESQVALINQYLDRYVDTNKMEQEDQYLLYYKARYLEKLGEHEKALKTYEKFLSIWGEKDGSSLEAIIAMAKIYEELNNSIETLKMYKKAVKVYDEYVVKIYKNKNVNGKRYTRLYDSAKNKIMELEK